MSFPKLKQKIYKIQTVSLWKTIFTYIFVGITLLFKRNHCHYLQSGNTYFPWLKLINFLLYFTFVDWKKRQRTTTCLYWNIKILWIITNSKLSATYRKKFYIQIEIKSPDISYDRLYHNCGSLENRIEPSVHGCFLWMFWTSTFLRTPHELCVSSLFHTNFTHNYSNFMADAD